jgi:predicted nucleic acid-binding protein
MIVVDASVMVEALLGRPAPRDRLAGELLSAPHLIDAEVASYLRRAVRSKELTAPDAAFALETFASSDLLRYEHTRLLNRVWELRGNLTPYDALYVALAEWHDVPLVTTDAKLPGAPGVMATIEVLPVGA